jgi:lactoylglutathione lyase
MDAPLGSGPYNARFQQTMLRIKDPKVSVPFYEKHFGMKLVHWIDFPQWKFTVYFLEIIRKGQVVPPCSLEKTTVENERYLNTMNGATVELTHNHGTELDPNFKVWNGNTGKDGDGPNHAEEPAARGFGHIAFNCDDVYAACEILEKDGVKFQKKPDDGRMKGLAFALDPDGYWLEIVKRKQLGWPEYYNLSQTMMRVKDGPATIEFYTKHLGMTLIRRMDMPQYGFTNFFLVSATPAELAEAAKLDDECDHTNGIDPTQPNGLTKVLWNVCLELTWNHGTENDPNFKVHDGNAQPQGFGHIGFLIDNIEESCAKMEAEGAVFKKRPQDGNMRGIAFVYDPNGYWIELIDRKASFVGTCKNY